MTSKVPRTPRTPTPITMGDITQDATTEAALEVLGSPGFDGIDDTDIETLHAFVINVMRRANEKLVEAKRIGRPVELVWDLTSDSDAAGESNYQDPRRSSPETSSHPSASNWMPQVFDLRGDRYFPSTPGAGSNVTSIVGKQRRSKGGG